MCSPYAVEKTQKLCSFLRWFHRRLSKSLLLVITGNRAEGAAALYPSVREPVALSCPCNEKLWLLLVGRTCEWHHYARYGRQPGIKPMAQCLHLLSEIQPFNILRVMIISLDQTWNRDTHTSSDPSVGFSSHVLMSPVSLSSESDQFKDNCFGNLGGNDAPIAV